MAEYRQMAIETDVPVVPKGTPFVTPFPFKTRGQAAKERQQAEERAARRAARKNDPDTSKKAAVTGLGRRTSQRFQLALAHYHHPDGLTDDEAARAAGIDPAKTPSLCYWKRLGELRQMGYLEETTETRQGLWSDNQRMVSRITLKGALEVEAALRKERDSALRQHERSLTQAGPRR